MRTLAKSSLAKAISYMLTAIFGVQQLLPLLFLLAASTTMVMQDPPPAEAINKVANWGFTGNANGWGTHNGTGANWSDGNIATENTFSTFGYLSSDGNTPTGNGSFQAIQASKDTDYRGSITQAISVPGSGNVKITGRMDYKTSNSDNHSVDVDSSWVRLDLYQADGTTFVGNLVAVAWARNGISSNTWLVAPFATPFEVAAGTTYVVRATMRMRLRGNVSTTMFLDNIIINSAPTGLTSSAPVDTTNATLSWDTSVPGSGASPLNASTPYRLYKATGAASYALFANPSTNTYSDTTTIGNTTYNYYVIDRDTNSIDSPSSSVVTQLTRPGAPGNPTFSDPTENAVTVSWTAPTGGSPTYAVERAPDSGGSPGTWVNIATTSATTYPNSGLSSSTTYWYRVRGVNATGYGAYSGQQSVTTDTPAGPTVTLTVGSPTSPLSEGSENIIRRGKTYQWIERLIMTASGGDVTINSLRIRRDAASDLPLAAVGPVRLYRDNGDGNFNSSSDTLMGTTTALDQWIGVSSNNVITTVSAASARTFHVVADITSTSTNYSKFVKTLIDGTDIQSNATTYSGTANSNNNMVYGGDITASASSAGGSIDRNIETTAMTMTITPTQGWSLVNAVRVYVTGSAQASDLQYLKVFQGNTELGTWSSPAGGQSQQVDLVPDQDTSAASYNLSIKLKTSNTAVNSRTFGVIITSAAAITADAPPGGINGTFPLNGALFTVAALPSAPASLVATAISHQEITLSWQDNSDNEDGFKIERKTSTGTYANIATVAANTTTHMDTNLTPSTQYFYRVRAYNGTGNSTYSAEANATTNPAPSTTQLNVGEGSGISSGQSMSPGTQYALMHLALSASNGTVTASYVTLRLTGSYTSGEMVSVAVHRDNTPTGTFGAEDPVISNIQSNPSPNNPYQLNLTTTQTIAAGSSVRFWVAGRVAAQPTPVNGRTVRIKIDTVAANPVVSTSYSPNPLLSQYTHTLNPPTLAVGSPNSQAAANIYRGGTSQAVERLVFTASGSITITSVAVSNIGTLLTQYVNFTRLQRESNGQQLGAMTGINGYINLSPPLQVTSGTSLSARTLLIRTDIATSAPSDDTVITRVTSADVTADTNSQNISGTADSETQTVKGAPLTVSRGSPATGSVARSSTTTAMVLTLNPTAGWAKVTDLRFTLSSSNVQSGDLTSITVKRLGSTLGTWSDPIGGQSQTIALSPVQDVSTSASRTLAVDVTVANPAENNDSFQVQQASASDVIGDSAQIIGSPAFPLQSGVLIVPVAIGSLNVLQGTGVSSNLQIPIGTQENAMHVRLTTGVIGDVDVGSMRVTLTGSYTTGEIVTMAVHKDNGVIGTWEPSVDTALTPVRNNPVANTGYTLSYSVSDSISAGSDAYYWLRTGITSATSANGKKFRGVVNAIGSNAGSTSGTPLTSSYEHTIVMSNLALGNQPIGGTVYKGETDKLIERLILTASNSIATISSLRVDNTGTGTVSADYSMIKIKTTPGITLGTGAFGSSIPLFPIQSVNPGQTTGFYIYLDAEDGATVGRTFRTEVQNSYVGTNATVTGGPRTGSLWTLQSGNLAGANGAYDPGTAISQGENKVVQQLRFDATVGGVTMNSVRIQLTAANGLLQNDIAAIRLYTDNDGDGSVSGETELGSTWSNPTLNSYNTFSFSSNVAVGTPKYLLVRAELTQNAAVGGTFRTRVASNTDVGSDAQSTTGAPYAGNQFAVQSVERPLTPTGLRITGFTATSFTVAWENPVASANRLWIGSTIVDIPSYASGTTQYEFTSASPSTAYIVKIMAYNGIDASSFSPPVRVNTRYNPFSKPHDRFNDNNSSCKACHSIHVARSQTKLLFFMYSEDTTSYTTETIPSPIGTLTVKRPRVDLCFNCHDGSGADNNIKSLYDNAIPLQGYFPGHITKVTGTYNGIGWKGNIKGMPARTQLPCLTCHDVHSSSRRGSNGQRGNTKNISDFLVTYASLTQASSLYGNSKGNWQQTSAASTAVPQQYNYPPYEVINTTGFTENKGDIEKCVVCHHGDKEGDMIVAGLDEWLPTVAYKDQYGITVPAHTDRKTCDCHIGNSYDQTKPNVHTLGKKPQGPVVNCADCHSVVYGFMKATGAYGTSGHSDRNFHHRITVAPSETGKTTSYGSCTSMCHSDHGPFRRPSDAFVLWTEVSTPYNSIGATSLAYQTSANTDYIPGVSAGYSVQGGLCLSCHRLVQYSHSTEAAVFIPGTQTTNANETSNRPHAVINSSSFQTSTHNFVLTISYTGLNGANQDGSWFQHNCTKCHRDNRTDSYSSDGVSLRAWRGPHASDYNSMLVATTALGRQEQTCFGAGVGLQRTGCHGSGRSPQYLDLEYLFTDTNHGPDRGHAKFLVSTATDNRHVGLTGPGSYNDAAGVQSDRSNPNNTPAGGPTRHVECQDCHNPHNTTTQAYLDLNIPKTDLQTSGYFYGRSQLHIKASNAIGGANFGVWGVEPNYNDSTFVTVTPDYYYGTGAAETTFTPVYPATKQYQLCFKCHSAYAYGRYQPSRPYIPSLSPQPRGGTFGQTFTNINQTDISQEFNPNNLGYHPILTVGRNQPMKHLAASRWNSQWPSYNGGGGTVTVSGVTATFSGTGIPTTFFNYYARPGVFLFIGSAAPAQGSTNWYEVTSFISRTQAIIRSSTTATAVSYFLESGLNATFVAPYGPRGLVVCTDCHSPETGSYAQGPHGSTQKWLLREANRNIYVDPGTTGNLSLQVNSGVLNAGTLCFNCHRRDVYGDGDGTNVYEGPNDCWSRFFDVNVAPGGCGGNTGHPRPGNDAETDPNNSTGSSGNAWSIFCLNCHAGALGGIHGSSHDVGDGSTPLGKRLFSGAARTRTTGKTDNVGGWTQTGVDVTCFTKDSDNLSNCTEHTGSGKEKIQEASMYDYTGF